MMKKLLPLLLVVLMWVMTGCGETHDTPMTFEKEGMTVTLSDAFTEQTPLGCAAAYSAEDITVKFDYDTLSVLPDTNGFTLAATAMEYAAHEADGAEVTEAEDLVYFDYETSLKEMPCTCRSYFFKNEHDIWRADFYVYKGFEEAQELLNDFARSVQFEGHHGPAPKDFTFTDGDLSLTMTMDESFEPSAVLGEGTYISPFLRVDTYHIKAEDLVDELVGVDAETYAQFLWEDEQWAASDVFTCNNGKAAYYYFVPDIDSPSRRFCLQTMVADGQGGAWGIQFVSTEEEIDYVDPYINDYIYSITVSSQ